MKKAILLLIVYICTNGIFAQIKAGFWRFELKNEGGNIPFNMELKEKNGSYKAYLLNSEERIELDNIKVNQDSLHIPLHIFDASLLLKVSGNQMRGVYRKYFLNSDQELIGSFGEKYRFFEESGKNKIDFSGKWAAEFSKTEGGKYPAIVLLNQKKNSNKITGTIMTPTGDFRFLEGNVKNNELYLSTFDGGFAVLFKAHLENEQLVGEFWSAKTKNATWVAKPDEKAQLPDADKITFLKEGYDKISFNFPNLEGKTVSLEDEKYKNKVVILQIFGSWCPNCMDETAFLAKWYSKNKNKAIAIIGLAYERKPDFEYARQMVAKVVKRFSVEYDFVIAGVNDKTAAQTLPMLNGIFSYPTTIFIDKKGKVRKIHTGFSGPSTGEYYQKWREEFNSLMNTLLKE
ncbi:MAG: TlpA disulfide reductase family protein [Thermonemataceae bacterium]|nr:TlpA disulfide reductase family protein [Thermonemataceae bacterium]